METSWLERHTSKLEQACSKFGRRLTTAALLAVTVFLSAGCPTYEDARSGTYVEVRQSALNEELLIIDFFRFGYYSNAIVRRYRVPQSASSEELFDQPISCAWTETGQAPDEQGAWTLPFEAESTLRGEFLDEETLSLTIDQRDESGTSVTESKTLKLYREQPDNSCDVIRPLLLEANFKLPNEASNALPRDVDYALRQPTFAMLWAGVTFKRQGQSAIAVAKNDVASPLPLSATQNFDRQSGELLDALRFPISPPEERALQRSGSTRYALAHFLVIDDACAQQECAVDLDEPFRWEIDEEPIVATALQRGNEVDSPFPNATGLGKAVLFIQGSLEQVGPEVRDLLTERDRALYVGRAANAHFYVVDLFFDDSGNVVGLRLAEDPERLTSPIYRRATLKMTDAYLNSSQIRLPRILPYELGR